MVERHAFTLPVPEPYVPQDESVSGLPHAIHLHVRVNGERARLVHCLLADPDLAMPLHDEERDVNRQRRTQPLQPLEVDHLHEVVAVVQPHVLRQKQPQDRVVSRSTEGLFKRRVYCVERSLSRARQTRP